MPIFTSSTCFAGYSFRAIDPALAGDLFRLGDVISPKRARTFAPLIRLECFLQLTGRRLSAADITSPATATMLAQFVVAVYSPRFHVFRQPWSMLIHLRNLFVAYGLPASTFPYFPATWGPRSWRDDFGDRVKAFDDQPFDSERLDYWRGWVAMNLDGQLTAFTLWRIRDRYGAIVATELHRAASQWFAARRHEKVPCFREFVAYLDSREDVVDVSDALSLGAALGDFFTVYFSRKYDAGCQLSSLIVCWCHFANFMNNTLLGKNWASPLPVLPRPRIRSNHASRTHLRRTSEGSEVRQALLTDVPLQITDTQCKEILFKTIRSDQDCIVEWARAEVRLARERRELRHQRAPHGVVSQTGRAGVNTGQRYRVSRACPEHLTHAAATFEHAGFAYLLRSSPRVIWPLPMDQTAWELGIPTPQLLLAHAAILVANHPHITTSFLETLELYDTSGRVIGFVPTDGGWYLVGVKRRKGSATAEQRILLTAESRAVVEEVIALTQPLRAWLRGQSDDQWRRLFLCTRSMALAPYPWAASNQACNGSAWIGSRIEQLCNVDAIRARALGVRFTLKRLRASAAVLVYLETGSVQAMSKALGHEEWKPTLLDRYLPKPIQEFFVERWIRLFQTGILCEALRESPLLQQAAAFATMDDMDAFLETHALRVIPAHMRDPQNVSSDRPPTPVARVVFGLDTGILTILLSLQYAVREAATPPCGRALRWASLSEKLFAHLDTQTEQPEFCAMAKVARRHADASTMARLIHA